VITPLHVRLLLGLSLVMASGIAALADDTSTAEPDKPGWFDRNVPPPPIAGTTPYLPDGRTLGADGLPIPCRCLANARSFAVGEVVCLSTPRGLYKARCERMQNVTSWIIGDEPCATM